MGSRDVQLSKERFRHGKIVMLAGVDYDVPEIMLQPGGKRSQLDKLRARPDN
jgi:hypothetical protein